MCRVNDNKISSHNTSLITKYLHLFSIFSVISVEPQNRIFPLRSLTRLSHDVTSIIILVNSYLCFPILSLLLSPYFSLQHLHVVINYCNKCTSNLSLKSLWRVPGIILNTWQDLVASIGCSSVLDAVSFRFSIIFRKLH